MTIQDLINWFSSYQYLVLGYFVAILVLALLMNVIVKPNNISNIKYVMSALVYGVAVPGMLAIFLVLYNILFLNTSILQISIVAYFLPIVAMVATLIVLNQKVKMNQLPGFNRLSGLFIMIAIAFGIIFVLQRTYFGVLILGGFTQVLIVFAVLMIILRVAWSRLTK